MCSLFLIDLATAEDAALQQRTYKNRPWRRASEYHVLLPFDCVHAVCSEATNLQTDSTGVGQQGLQ